jgi:hypothetical protein
MVTASSGVLPPLAQSCAEMRTDIGRSAGHAARIARNTSSGKRQRFASVPPYSSVRRLVSGQMNADNRYPCAQCSSSQSKPQSAPHCAARTNSFLTRAKSSAVIARGTWLRGPYAMADGAISGQLPSGSGSSASSQPTCVEPFGPA